MKKNRIIAILMIAVTTLFISCGEFEEVIYDVDNGQTLAKFSGSGGALPVKETEVSSKIINIEVSTVSSSDRTLSVVLDNEMTTATGNQYTLSDFVIPAGEYIGSGSVTGVFSELPELGSVEVVLNLSAGQGVDVVENGTYKVTLERFCEFDITEFYGTYDVVEDGSFNYQVTATAGPVEGTISLFNLYETGGNTIIELDNSNPGAPIVLFRSFEFTAALYVSATWGNVYAEQFSDSTTSTFNVCGKSFNLFFFRRIPDGRRFAGETNCVMSKL